MSTMELEVSKLELIREILDINSAEVLNHVRQVVGRAIKQNIETPCTYSLDEVKQRLASTTVDAVSGQGISEAEADKMIEEMV